MWTRYICDGKDIWKIIGGNEMSRNTHSLISYKKMVFWYNFYPKSSILDKPYDTILTIRRCGTFN